jgi:TonB family protein
MRVTLAVFVTVLLVACIKPSYARNDAWRSYPNGLMAREIVCPAGLQKIVPAATSLDLFAGLWKPQPMAQSKNELEWPAFHSHADLHNMTRESGNVLVELLIGKQGQIVAAKVICSNNPVLDAAALRVAEDAHYRPAKIAGMPILSVIRRPINFGG